MQAAVGDCCMCNDYFLFFIFKVVGWPFLFLMAFSFLDGSNSCRSRLVPGCCLCAVPGRWFFLFIFLFIIFFNFFKNWQQLLPVCLLGHAAFVQRLGCAWSLLKYSSNFFFLFFFGYLLAAVLRSVAASAWAQPVCSAWLLADFFPLFFIYFFKSALKR